MQHQSTYSMPHRLHQILESSPPILFSHPKNLILTIPLERQGTSNVESAWSPLTCIEELVVPSLRVRSALHIILFPKLNLDSSLSSVSIANVEILFIVIRFLYDCRLPLNQCIHDCWLTPMQINSPKHVPDVTM